MPTSIVPAIVHTIPIQSYKYNRVSISTRSAVPPAVHYVFVQNIIDDNISIEVSIHRAY